MNISMNPNGELYQSAVNAPGAIEIPESFLNEARQFRELNMRYACAIREVKTKLEVLNDDLAIRNQRNPIQMIKSRVKKPESIIEKLHRRGFPIAVKSVRENLYDVAGIRVICSFVDDIYTVAEMLARQDDINVLMVKDYIRCPKVNGYRSYHMILYYTVETINGPKRLQVEIQIRTMAMNFWATIEHSLQYKYKGDMPPHVAERLSKASDAIISLDHEMSSVRNEIMDAQNSSQMQSNLVKDILNNIENLYRVSSEREVSKIQDEFLRVFKTKDLRKLERFHRQLDIIAEGYRAQAVHHSM